MCCKNYKTILIADLIREAVVAQKRPLADFCKIDIKYFSIHLLQYVSDVSA